MIAAMPVPPVALAAVRVALGWLLLTGALAAAEANRPPTLVAAYAGPALDPLLGRQVVAISLSGLGPGLGEETAQSVTVVAHPLDSALLVVDGVDREPGAATARVRVRLAGASVPAASGRILITAIDDGVPMGVTTAVVDLPLVASDAPPEIWRLEYADLEPGWTYPLSDFALLAHDPEGGQVTCTLRSLPTLGALSLTSPVDGSRRRLAVGDTFTQEDLSERRLDYRPDAGVVNRLDGFAVAIADGTGDPGPAGHWLPLYVGAPRDPPGELRIAVAAGPWFEGDAPLAIAAGATLDLPQPAAAGARLVCAPGGGWHPGDRVLLLDQGLGSGQAGLAGSAVLVDGQPVGTWTSSVDGGLEVAISADGLAAVQLRTLVRALAFEHRGDDPGSHWRSATVTIEDGRGTPIPPAPACFAVRAIDDPPLIAPARAAIPAGVPVTITLAASDADSPLLAWSVVTADPGLAASALGGGVFLVTAAQGSNGQRRLRVRVDDGHLSTEAEVAVLVSGTGAPRPHPAGDPPREAYPGHQLAFELPWEAGELGADAVLDFAVAGEVPPGLTLVRSGPRQVGVRWQVPADEPVSTHRRLILVATDTAGRGAARMPISIWIRPAPAGRG
jgi:hypothetical protein